MRVVLRPTVPTDLPHCIGEPLPHRIQAITAVLRDAPEGAPQDEGRIIGLGGIGFRPGCAALALGHYALTPADAGQAVDLLSGIASTVGGLIVIYGRVVATPKIGA